VARDERLTVGAIDNRVAMSECFDFQDDALRQVIEVNTICGIGLDRVWMRRLILTGIKHTVLFLLHDAAHSLKWISAQAATSLSSISGCGGALPETNPGKFRLAQTSRSRGLRSFSLKVTALRSAPRLRGWRKLQP